MFRGFASRCALPTTAVGSVQPPSSGLLGTHLLPPRHGPASEGVVGGVSSRESPGGVRPSVSHVRTCFRVVSGSVSPAAEMLPVEFVDDSIYDRITGAVPMADVATPISAVSEENMRIEDVESLASQEVHPCQRARAGWNCNLWSYFALVCVARVLWGGGAYSCDPYCLARVSALSGPWTGVPPAGTVKVLVCVWMAML